MASWPMFCKPKPCVLNGCDERLLYAPPPVREGRSIIRRFHPGSGRRFACVAV